MPRQEAARIRWCFTLNNYSDLITDIDGSKRWVIGEEIGEQGTKHLQGYVEYEKRIRFSSVKKSLPDGCHIEPANGSPEQNYKYCTKDGKFTKKGSFSFNQNHCEAVIDSILSGRDDHLTNIHYIRYKRSYDDVVNEINSKKRKTDLTDKYKDLKLTPLQYEILDYLNGQSDREILWITDVKGGCGKSTLARYLWAVANFQLFDGVTKSSDIAYLIDPDSTGFIFDVTRDNSSHFNYTTLEQLKNGYIMTGKYSGRTVFFEPKPVLVVSNFIPICSKLSLDRWNILYIQNGKIQEIWNEEEGLPSQDYIPEPEDI